MRLLDVVAPRVDEFEVIVVVDGGDDLTAVKARSIPATNVRVIEYAENQGKGYAIRHGFRYSTGSRVAYIDADLDLHPQGILDLIAVMDETDADCVVGSKVHPASAVAYPPTRRVLSRVYRRFVKALFSLEVSDTQTGLKVFKRPVLEEVLPVVATDRFAFDLELLAAANDAGYTIADGPVRLDFQFSSTVDAASVFQVLSDTLKIASRRRSMRRAARVPEPVLEPALDADA